MNGLARVSVCLMEDMASQNVPAIGYGLRYQFGSFIFRIEELGE